MGDLVHAELDGLKGEKVGRWKKLVIRQMVTGVQYSSKMGQNAEAGV